MLGGERLGGGLRNLAADGGRLPVFTQTQENRLPHAPVPSPFLERHLANQLRSHPVRRRVGGGTFLERTGFLYERLEPGLGVGQ